MFPSRRACSCRRRAHPICSSIALAGAFGLLILALVVPEARAAMAGGEELGMAAGALRDPAVAGRAASAEIAPFSMREIAVTLALFVVVGIAALFVLDSRTGGDRRSHF